MDETLKIGTCPASGLPIYQHKDWRNITFGTSHYKLDLYLIGNSILHSKVTGAVHYDQVIRALAYIDKILAKHVPKNVNYTFIEDYSELGHTSLRAKNEYIQYLKHNPRIKKCVFYSVTPFMKILIELSKNSNFISFPVHIADSYDEAVEYATSEESKISVLKMAALRKGKTEHLHRTGNCMASKLPIFTRPEWKNVELSKTYMTTFELIGTRIIKTIPQGYADINGIQNFIKVRKKILKEIGLWDNTHIEIRDLSQIRRVPSKSVRMKYTEFLLQEDRRGHLAGFFGYNASAVVRFIFNVGQKLNPHTLNMEIFQDYGQAILKAKETLETFETLSRKPVKPSVRIDAEFGLLKKIILQLRGHKHKKKYSMIQLEDFSSDLLHFMGSINWHTKGLDLDKIPKNHPFRDLFEAIAIIKFDFDNIIKERENAMKVMMHSSKLASIGEMAAGVGHEISNPLTIIQGYTGMLKEELKHQTVNRNTLSSFIANQEKALVRLKNISNMLRNYSRKDTDTKEKIEINKLLEESVPLFKEMLSKDNISIQLILTPAPTEVRGNGGRFQQVLTNLFTNAKDAIGRDGTITIETRENGKDLQILFSDDGCGITPEVLEKIFDTFFTTKDKGKGTGLGLGITHSIIESMKGKITVQSKKDHGTTFSINLPRQITEVAEEKIQGETDMGKSKGSILIVEDEEDVREIFEQYCVMSGMRCDTAENGLEALDHLDKNKYDLIITDLKMPKMSGQDLVRHVRAHEKERNKILIITGYDFEKGTPEYNEIHEKADMVIHKPVTQTEFNTAVKNLLDASDKSLKRKAS